MRIDLAIDKFQAPLSIGHLGTDTSREFAEQVAMFARGSFGILEELCDFTGEQRVPLGIEYRDVALRVLNLARDAQKLRGTRFAFDGSVDFAVIVQQTQQRVRVAAAVGLVGTGHQEREVLLLRFIASKVGMDTLGKIAEERLEAGRWVKLFNLLAFIAECSVVRLLRALASFRGPLSRGIGVVKVDFMLGDARFDVIELSVEEANLPEVPSFECSELSTQLCELRFALGKRAAKGGELPALFKEGVVRALMENDFGWHAAAAGVRW
jgi:hypothetical protein